MERVNYVIENGQYCAKAVNLPFIIQSDNLAELKESLKRMLGVYVNHLQKTLENEEFEFVEDVFNLGKKESDFMAIEFEMFKYVENEKQRHPEIDSQDSVNRFLLSKIAELYSRQPVKS